MDNVSEKSLHLRIDGVRVAEVDEAVEEPSGAFIQFLVETSKVSEIKAALRAESQFEIVGDGKTLLSSSGRKSTYASTKEVRPGTSQSRIAFFK